MKTILSGSRRTPKGLRKFRWTLPHYDVKFSAWTGQSVVAEIGAEPMLEVQATTTLLHDNSIRVCFPWETVSLVIIAHEAVHVGQFVAQYATRMKIEASAYPKVLYPHAWEWGMRVVRMEIAAEASASFVHACYVQALKHGVPLEAFQPRNAVEIDRVAVVDSQPEAHETGSVPRARGARRKRLLVP